MKLTRIELQNGDYAVTRDASNVMVSMERKGQPWPQGKALLEFVGVFHAALNRIEDLEARLKYANVLASDAHDSREFVARTNAEYAAWCHSFYQADCLDENGMKSLDGLWAWQEQERRFNSANARIEPVIVTGLAPARTAEAAPELVALVNVPTTEPIDPHFLAKRLKNAYGLRVYTAEGSHYDFSRYALIGKAVEVLESMPVSTELCSKVDPEVEALKAENESLKARLALSDRAMAQVKANCDIIDMQRAEIGRLRQLLDLYAERNRYMRGVFQGGMSNHELRVAWGMKVHGAVPTDEQLTSFALGVEFGQWLTEDRKTS